MNPVSMMSKPRKPKAPVTSPVPDPFAPMSESAISKVIGRFAGQYGQPQSDEQIQSQARSSLQPIIDSITQNINSQTDRGAAAVNARADAVANYLRGINFGAPYEAARKIQSENDTQLQGALASAGNSVGQDIASRLGVINDPTVGVAQQVASAQGAQGAGEVARASSASLGNLIANGAAAGSYGLKQPGIALGAGQQDLADLYSGAQTQIGDKTSQILAELPSILASLQGRSEQRRDSRARLSSDLYTTLKGQNITKATANAGLTGDAAKLNYDYANATADANASAARLAEQNRHNVANETVATQRADTAAKATAAREKAKAAKPKYSATKIQTWKGRARQIARFAYEGHVDQANPKNNSDPQDYPAALEAMREEGIPDQIATTVLSQFYTTPGERGRPFKGKPATAADTAAARKAVQPPSWITGGQ